jgi:hypothetical protein
VKQLNRAGHAAATVTRATNARRYKRERIELHSNTSIFSAQKFKFVTTMY